MYSSFEMNIETTRAIIPSKYANGHTQHFPCSRCLKTRCRVFQLKRNKANPSPKIFCKSFSRLAIVANSHFSTYIITFFICATFRFFRLSVGKSIDTSKTFESNSSFSVSGYPWLFSHLLIACRVVPTNSARASWDSTFFLFWVCKFFRLIHRWYLLWFW